MKHRTCLSPMIRSINGNFLELAYGIAIGSPYQSFGVCLKAQKIGEEVLLPDGLVKVM